MNAVPCGLCNAVEEEPLLETADYITGEWFRVVRCRSCGLVYVSPRPAEEELSRYYPQTHQQSEPAAYERADARPRIRLVAALLGGRSGRVLDVGCGKGLLLRGLQERGWEVVGTELSEVSSRFAAGLGIPVHRVCLEEYPGTPGNFDVITLYHSLEHMVDPLRTLKAAHRLLRPGGYLVVEVPNFGSWYARLFRGAWFFLDVPRHLYHFTPHTLGRLVDAAGFRIARETLHNTQYDAFGAVQSLLNMALRRQNLLNDYNTGEVSLAELWRGPGRLRSMGALAVSLGALGVGFPVFALVALLLRRWVDGGTLRIVATREPAPSPPRSGTDETPSSAVTGEA